ncbi:retropepsin-like aspartic protease [Salibacterium aidingense]|uniref:retropepsin-like aspartic protease n=1 Tax=Salibacterium aidingense TaxID=384933 RepID=UPI0006844698|nr:retropepsin-like aspartic protease [Salibacterium aidingense]
MKKLMIDDGLLLTDMELRYSGQSLHIQRILIDTGSGSTVVSTDLAESIGIVAEQNDMIYRISGVGGSEFVYSKTVDLVKIGSMQTEDFAIEIGAMNYGFDLDGIIGLDLLQQLKAVINIDELSLQSNS